MKFIEISEENDAKRRVEELELEEKRLKQAREHEEKMTGMMFNFIERIVQSQRHAPPSGFSGAPHSTPQPFQISPSFYSFNLDESNDS